MGLAGGAPPTTSDREQSEGEDPRNGEPAETEKNPIITDSEDIMEDEFEMDDLSFDEMQETDRIPDRMPDNASLSLQNALLSSEKEIPIVPSALTSPQSTLDEEVDPSPSSSMPKKRSMRIISDDDDDSDELEVIPTSGTTDTTDSNSKKERALARLQELRNTRFRSKQ
jgi:hypothetical protein